MGFSLNNASVSEMMQKADKFQHTFVVSDAVYKGFIAVFRDENPLHTDPSFARSMGFKGVVMHGNILNGFVSYFIGECLPQKNVMILSQKINFSLPVFLDDVLSFHAEIVDFYDSVQTYEFKFYFVNQAGQKVARGEIQTGLLS